MDATHFDVRGVLMKSLMLQIWVSQASVLSSSNLIISDFKFNQEMMMKPSKKWTIGQNVPKDDLGVPLPPLVKKKMNPVVRFISLAIGLPLCLPAYALGYLYGICRR